MSVVIYHLWPERLIGGFMGVDIFFVISGYLMTTTILKDIAHITDAKQKTKLTLSFLSSFYARRIKRLIPAAAVTLIAITGLVVLTGQLTTISRTTEHVVAASLFGENWKLAEEAVNYLAASEPPTAVQHFWSLSVEEQFYLVWPLLLLGITLLTFHWNIVYKKRFKIPGAIIPVGLLTLSLFIYGYMLTKTDPAAAYFVTPARVWELLIGACIALLPKLKHYDLQLLLPWAGLALCLYGLYKIDGVDFPGWHALIPTIGTAMILYAGTNTISSRFSFGTIFKWRPIQKIGDISYSLYLWHWPLIVLVPLLIGVSLDEGGIGLALKLAILAASVGIAWLSFKFIEMPPQRMQLKKRTVYVGFAVIVTVIAGGNFFISQSAQAKANAAVVELHALAQSKDATCFGARAITNEKECGNQFGQANKVWAQFVTADPSMSIIEDKGRWCDYYRIGDQDDPTLYCQYGDLDASRQIVVWGDSHADQWVNALNGIGIRNNIKFIHLSNGTCAADKITSTECQDRMQFIKDQGFLKDSESIITTFLTRDDSTRSETVFKTLRELSDDKPIYYIQDVPIASKNSGPTCVFTNLSCKDPKDSALSSVNKLTNQLISNGVINKEDMIPTSDMFCDNEFCYGFIGGVSVYHDTDGKLNSHVSSVYALSLSEILEARLKTSGAL